MIYWDRCFFLVILGITFGVIWGNMGFLYALGITSLIIGASVAIYFFVKIVSESTVLDDRFVQVGN